MAAPRVYELSEEDHIDEFLETFPSCALFIGDASEATEKAYGVLEKALIVRPDIYIGWIRSERHPMVAEYALEVANSKKVLPTFSLFVDGEGAWSNADWSISPHAIGEAIEARFGPTPTFDEGGGCGHGCGCHGNDVGYEYSSDMSPYVRLLEKFVQGHLEEPEFVESWVSLFEKDKHARSADEFELICSLLDDEEESSLTRLGPSKVKLKQRAAQLLSILTQEVEKE